MLITILTILKTILFLNITKVEFNYIPILLTTSLITLLIIKGIQRMGWKNEKRIILTFYSIISLILFIDGMYYSQFGALPTISALGQAGQLAAVGDSIVYLLNIKNLGLVLDIPILVWIHFYGRGKGSTIRLPKISKAVQNHIILTTLALTLVHTSTIGQVQSIMAQEPYLYHLADLGRNLSLSSKAEANSTFTEEDLREIEGRRNLEEGELTGIGRGKNLIVLQVEALQNFVIDLEYNGQQVTPNLNKLVKDKSSVYYDRYYQLLGRGNTSDSEFVSHNSFHPSMEEPSYTKYENNQFYGLPLLLRDNGYTSWAMHGYKKDFWNRDKAYKNQGFERFISEEDYEMGNPIGLGLSDEDFFDQNIEYLKELDRVDENPFYAFMVTLTSHTPFHMPSKYEYLDILPEHKDTILGNYLQSIHYTDRAIGRFIENLEREGLYQDTVIAIYGDHFAISSANQEDQEIMTDFLGRNYNYDEMMRIPLIVHVPEEDINKKISTTGSQIDFYPTMMNIMGYKNEKGLIFGRDLTNYKEYTYVAPQTYILKGSFIDHDTVFAISRDGIFDHSRAYNIHTQEKVDIPQMRPVYEEAIREINKSDFILNTNLLKEYMERDGEVDLNKLTGRKILNGQYIVEKDFGSLDELSDLYNKGYRLFAMEVETTTLLPYLEEWTREHEDAYIVLRTGEEDENILVEAHRDYSGIRENSIIEIKDFQTYSKLTFNGFANIILNPMEKAYKDEEILDFVQRHPHFGVILHRERGNTSLPRKLKEEGVLTYIDGPTGRFSRTILERRVEGFIINPEEEKGIKLDHKPAKYKNPHIVAHAGGEIGSRTYSNSLEALNKSYGRGIRLMEIDFEWTTDDELVCLHSWDGFLTGFFNQPVRQYSFEEFKNFQMINGWHQLTLEGLDRWFEQHSDAYLVTDIKARNIEGLKKIKEEYPNLARNTIPQIYQLDEYKKAKDLGYDEIILTLYIIRSTEDEIVNFVEKNDLFGVTMPTSRARTNLLKRVRDKGAYVYTHTVNSLDLADELEGLGVSGFYSDLLESK